MTVEPRLASLRRQALRRLDRLALLYVQAATGPPEELDRIVAHVVIETASTWAQYCRFYYLSSALGARDATGRPVLRPANRLGSVDAALTRAIYKFNPRLRGKTGPWDPRDEPDWTDPSVLSKAVRLVGASNAPQVARAVSANTRALRDLRTFRNFYAHRGHRSAERARELASRQYRLRNRAHPTQLLWSFPPGATERLLGAWLSDIRVVVELTA